MAKSQPRHTAPHAWYKRKRYIHFDFALRKPEAVNYVSDKENIIKHSFSPLIHYNKISRKLKRNKDAGCLRIYKKPRNIFYASHLDGYIYAYYNFLLGEKYEEYLVRSELSESVSAYRLIRRNGQNYSNIHFAKEAFDYVRSTCGCKILCFDITGFFDHLDVDTLKQNWCRVWSGEKSVRLDEDHYRVFKNVSNFHYVEEKDIIRVFNKTPRRRNKIDENKKQERIQELNRSLHERICSFPELRAQKLLTDHRPFVRNKSKLKITGIAQGTAISGLLANISMVDFDLALKSKIEKMGGFYRRYSDDIFVALPSSIEFDAVESYVVKILNKYSAGSLKINSDKTEKCVYQLKTSGHGVCYDEKARRSAIQYLGFVFNGTGTYIRTSSMSRNRSKIVSVIKRNKKGRSGKATLGNINTRQVYKAQSPRKITKYDEYENKGFSFYAKRSEGIQQAQEIKRQIRKNDRFIKKMIAEERKAPFLRHKEKSDNTKITKQA